MSRIDKCVAAQLLGLSLGLLDHATTELVSLGLVLSSGLWFGLVQAGWVRRKTRLPWWRCLLAALLVVVMGSVINTLVGYALSHTAIVAGTPGV